MMESCTRLETGVNRSRQSGMGMIEVLVALLVLAIGLMGVLGMETRGLQSNQAGYYQSQAMFLAQDILERIRANREAIDSYVIDFGAGSTGDCQTDTATCKPTEMAASDLYYWKQSLKDLLPSGDGKIEVTQQANGLYQVDVQVNYFVGKLNPNDAGDTGKYTYQLSAQI